MKLWEYIKKGMLAHPTQSICENRAELSFEDAVVWAEVFAKKLKGLRSCAVWCQSEMAAGLSLLACFSAGVTAIPLSARYGNTHCQKILDTISPDGIITDRDNEIEVVKITDNQYESPKRHPALILCTSGTTGRPKGAMLSDKNIITNVSDITEYFGVDLTDTILLSRPLYHGAVLTGEFLTALVKGCNIRFCSEHFEPYRILSLIQDYGITAFCGTPTFLGMMAKFKRNLHVETLRHIGISGECMGRDVGLSIARAFPHAKTYHLYGLTEAGPRVSYLPPELFGEYADCVGVPLRSVSLKIMTEDGVECPPNVEGILWVKGDNVMIGYYQEPERTAQVLKDGWLCTGDIAVINEMGLLKIRGRSDDLIIKSGMNIYPAEVESVMQQDPRVRGVYVYGFENRFGTQIGMTIAGDFNSSDEVRQVCIDRLPAFQVPSRIELVSELPSNASGKIIRRRGQP